MIRAKPSSKPASVNQVVHLTSDVEVLCTIIAKIVARVTRQEHGKAKA